MEWMKTDTGHVEKLVMMQSWKELGGHPDGEREMGEWGAN